MRTFLFPVDASHVLQFARAIGDPSPVFDDPQYAAIARRGDVTPPPTFLIAADHFDPACPRRPAPGEAFVGSGRVNERWSPPQAGSRPRRGMHAEEVFEFSRHPCVGELLTVTVRDGDEWEKAGRNGTLRFCETVSEYTDADGAPVAIARWRAVTSSPLPAGPQPSAAPSLENASPAAAPLTEMVPAVSPPAQPLRAGDVAVGDCWSAVVLDDLTIGHLVRYAGASGDFVALHHDRDIADRVGTYGGVFADGMLTMGVSSKVVSAVVGTSQVRRLSSRMLAIVRPGHTLTTTVWVEQVSAPAGDGSVSAELRLTTTTNDGAVALDGAAEAVLEP